MEVLNRPVPNTLHMDIVVKRDQYHNSNRLEMLLQPSVVNTQIHVPAPELQPGVSCFEV